MDTIIATITDNEEQNDRVFQKAADIIQSGGLVAFPTETVYGLGGDAFDDSAAAKIYAAKGRPSDNPLIVPISEISDMEKLSDDVPEIAYRLADRFWPGPLTMIVNKNKSVPMSVTGGLDTVGIRLPSNPVARRFIKESGTFIAAPSANLSGRPSPTRGAHVIEDLMGRIDMIIDGGNIEIGLESTIVDLTEDVPVILRPGYITQEMLSDAVGEVRLDRALMTGVAANVRPKAPGMKYRHYAPKAAMTVVEGDTDNVVAYMQNELDRQTKDGHKVGLLLSKANAEAFDCGEIISLGDRNDEEEIARNLFAALREFDSRGVDVIYSEAFPEDGVGQAVMNRLMKAAGHTIVHV